MGRTLAGKAGNLYEDLCLDLESSVQAAPETLPAYYEHVD